MRDVLTWLLDVLVLALYFGIGAKLSTSAHRHLREPDKDTWYTPMFEPGKFTPEGNALRRRALRFWNWGGLALLIYFFVL